MWVTAQAVSAVSGAVNANAVASGAGAKNLPQAASGPAGASSPFADLVTGAVDQVDQLEVQASTAVSGLMTGTGVDVHQAMIATEKATMAFELALAVRNKAVQAYESVMSMQF